MLLVDDNPESGDRCEAILAKLRFAVAPARSADEALRIMAALRPDLVVARADDAATLRRGAPEHVPVVVLTDDNMDPESLVGEIRSALRAKKR